MLKTIEDCPRCHETHEDLTFKLLKSAQKGATHWVMCPKIKEPIFARIEISPIEGESFDTPKAAPTE